MKLETTIIIHKLFMYMAMKPKPRATTHKVVFVPYLMDVISYR
jgi:hypothetical protein